jgi:hypothetical protein
MSDVSWWPLVDDQGLPPNIAPSPGEFVATLPAEIAFFFIAGALVVIVAMPWAIRAAVKSRNYVPLLVIVSGLICSLLEPMLDVLGHLHWANNLTPVFTNFGITVPALIPLCYVGALTLQGYFFYFVIRNGAHLRVFYLMFAEGIITDAVMETIGINLRVYEYYGVQPFEFLGFPYWWAFINAGSAVTIGALLAYAVPRLKGANKLYLLIAAPTGMMLAYFGAGWVHILAHNSTLPTVLRWLAAATMMAMMVGWMRVLHHFVGRPDHLPAPRWTAYRLMLAYGRLTPGHTGRMALWHKMCEEGGVRPGDGIPADPEDPSLAIVVGPPVAAAHGPARHDRDSVV